MQLEVKPCKVEIWKGKKKVACGDKSGRNNELEGEMCLQYRMGNCLRKMNPGKNAIRPLKVLEKSWNFIFPFLNEPCKKKL